jgi:hypothetical protein
MGSGIQPTGTTNYVFFLADNNNVGIGTNNAVAKLTVHGNVLIGNPGFVNVNGPFSNGPYGLYVENGILTSRLRVATVNSANWADYVFMPGYKLRPLSEVNTFIQANHHLPDVPSAQQVEQNGLDMVEMDVILLKKIEELTLYIIDLETRLSVLEGDSTQCGTPAPGN